jgi:FAD:protein FMN transferase
MPERDRHRASQPSRPEPASATWRALGSKVHLLIVDGDIAVARRAVVTVLANVDETYSRFRPDSELSRLNARAGDVATLSPLMAIALKTALRAARLTDGLVDPTVGTSLRLLGYDEDFDRIAGRAGAITIKFEAVPGWQALRFDPVRRTLRMPRGVELDLGSTGKALAADLAAWAACAAIARTDERVGVLVGLGGDIAIAGEPPPGGWRILAAEDSNVDPGANGEVIALRDGALATSSTTVRRWVRGNVGLHHLIDPRTGLPAYGPWRTVSVIAGTCVDANIASTAAIIRGESAPTWLAERGLAARLVATDGTVERVGEWPLPGTAPNPVTGPKETRNETVSKPRQPAAA